MAGLDCTNNNLTVEDYLKGILGKDANDNCALRLLVVGDGNAPYQTCDISTLSAKELLMQILDVNAQNKLALRVIQGVDSGDDCIDCNNNHETLEELIANSVIGLADDGKPALRITL